MNKLFFFAFLALFSAPVLAEQSREGEALFQMIERRAPVAEIGDYIKTSGLDIFETNSRCEDVGLLSIRVGRLDVFDYLDKNFKLDLNRSACSWPVASYYSYALLYGDFAFISDLKKRGGDLSLLKADGATDLIKASEKNGPDVLEALIKRGESIHSVNTLGVNAVMSCVRYSSNVNSLKFLLKAGGDIKRVDAGGYGILFNAFLMQAPRTFIETLISAGASVDERSEKPSTPTPLLVNAIRFCNLKAADYLLDKGVNVLATDDEGNDALIAAGDRAGTPSTLDLMKKLIKAGLKSTTVNKNGFSSLLRVATAQRDSDPKYGLPELEYLIAQGANVNQIGTRYGRYRESALSLVAPNCEAAKIAALVKAGADVEFKDFLGATPLQLVISHSKGECAESARELAKGGANLNVRNSWNDTPLMTLALFGHSQAEDIIRVLVDAGADKKATDTWGNTAYKVAEREKRSSAILNLLRP